MRTLFLVLLLALPAVCQGDRDRRSLDLFDLGNGLMDAMRHLDRYRQLESLNLSFNELKELPRIPYLNGVRDLDLSGNKLTAVPPELAQARSLHELDLRGNQLVHLGRPPWQGMPLLDTLDLGENQLTDLGDLKGLERLITLDLSDNQLTRLPAEIGRLRSLRHLDLSRNPLTTLPPEIGRLTRLEELTLDGTPLVSLPPQIGQLKALRRLDLEDTPLKSFPPQLGELRRLVTLSATGCQARIPDSFRGLKGLKWIFVGNLAPAELERVQDLLPWAEVIPIP